MRNYYFPDFNENSCGYGRDYPAWFGSSGYEKFYLFEDADLCCSRYFANSGSTCPFENNKQTDYYWTTYEDNIDNLVDMPVRYNHTYYPDLFGKTCVNGTDYPSYMASDKDFLRYYIFKTLEGCCKEWFTTVGLDSCKNDVIQGVYNVTPCPINRPDCNNVASISNVTVHQLTMWYPDLDGLKCKNDGGMESFMLLEEYTELYLFNTRAQCCNAFGYC